jgi:hypothetical protein
MDLPVPGGPIKSNIFTRFPGPVDGSGFVGGFAGGQSGRGGAFC